MPTAGILVIGNEILSGKVVDVNSPHLCRELRPLGVDVERITVIPDHVEVIAREVRAMSDAYEFVLTTGGVGPTHDDLTMDGVALAFGRRVRLHEQLAERFRSAPGGMEGLLKMAMIPEGATLLDGGDVLFPVVLVENVYVLPGIPQLMQRKFRSIRDRFRGVPFELKRVYVTRHESEIAGTLQQIVSDYPDLTLGSYPRTGEGSYRVMLTLESRDPDCVKRALERLLERLPGGTVQKVE